MTKRVANQLQKPTRFVRTSQLIWGESKTSFSSLITPTGHQMLRSKAAEMQLSKSNLLEYLLRCLDDPAIEGAVKRQITAK